MRAIILSSIFCAIVLSSSSGYASIFTAENITAEKLYSLCTVSESSDLYDSDYVRCLVYIGGVFDHATVTTLKAHPCMSSRVTTLQVMKTFIAYIDRNPQKMHLPADSVV